MKTRSHRFPAIVSVAIVSFIFLCVIPPGVSAADRMVIVYFEDYAPFSWKQKDGTMKGLLVDLITEALQKRMVIQLEHRGYPWARAQQMVRNGEADAFCTVPTDERRQYAEMSIQPLIRNSVTLFTWKGNPRIPELKRVKGVQDLSPFRHCQYGGSGWARENLKDMDITWVASPGQALEMLAARRGDLIVDSAFVIRHQIRSMNLQDAVIEIPALIATNSFHLCVGKQSRFLDILPRFDQTLSRMQADGTHGKIAAKYR